MMRKQNYKMWRNKKLKLGLGFSLYKTLSVNILILVKGPKKERCYTRWIEKRRVYSFEVQGDKSRTKTWPGKLSEHQAVQQLLGPVFWMTDLRLLVNSVKIVDPSDIQVSHNLIRWGHFIKSRGRHGISFLTQNKWRPRPPQSRFEQQTVQISKRWGFFLTESNASLVIYMVYVLIFITPRGEDGSRAVWVDTINVTSDLCCEGHANSQPKPWRTLHVTHPCAAGPET